MLKGIVLFTAYLFWLAVGPLWNLSGWGCCFTSPGLEHWLRVSFGYSDFSPRSQTMWSRWNGVSKFSVFCECGSCTGMVCTDYFLDTLHTHSDVDKHLRKMMDGWMIKHVAFKFWDNVRYFVWKSFSLSLPLRHYSLNPTINSFLEYELKLNLKKNVPT